MNRGNFLEIKNKFLARRFKVSRNGRNTGLMGQPLECRRDCRGSLVIQLYCISCFPGYLTVYPVNGFAPKYLKRSRQTDLKSKQLLKG